MTLGASLGAGLVTVAACSSEPDVKYGNPSTLNKDNLPGEAGLEPLSCGEGGVVTTDDGGCAVSWKNDIYMRMIGNDGWQCATSQCHAPGKQSPSIDPADAGGAYASLSAYKMSTRPQLNYIDKSKDPSKSSIECNLSGACNPAMPIGGGKPLTDDERCKLHVWLQCGAPNN